MDGTADTVGARLVRAQRAATAAPAQQVQAKRGQQTNTQNTYKTTIMDPNALHGHNEYGSGGSILGAGDGAADMSSVHSAAAFGGNAAHLLLPQQKILRNYKLVVDPFLVKGREKLYRYDGTMPSDPAMSVVLPVRDPRNQLARLRHRQEALELPVPRYYLFVINCVPQNGMPGILVCVFCLFVSHLVACTEIILCIF